MVNISFEEAQAKIWQAEVKAELELVAKVNADAGRCMQDLAEEGGSADGHSEENRRHDRKLGGTFAKSILESYGGCGKSYDQICRYPSQTHR